MLMNETAIECWNIIKYEIAISSKYCKPNVKEKVGHVEESAGNIISLQF